MGITRRSALIFLLVLGLVALPLAAWLVWKICVSKYSEEMRLVSPDDIVRLKERDDYINKPAKPTLVRLVKVSLGGSETGIDVSYTKIAKYELNGGKIEDLIDNILLKDFDPGFKDIKFVPENGTPLSRLSLRNKEAAYIVFILECGNCRFVNREKPFRVERDKAKYHFDPRVVWKTSETATRHDKMPNDDNIKSTVGYFIAYGNEEYGNSKRFRSNFNFYLDLTYSGQQPVPISIDPDVGYPGGHAPIDEQP